MEKVSSDTVLSPTALYVSRDREIAPHLRAALERLSSEHHSGISRAQHDTPMMKQYISAKDEVPDAVVFFRMGDFFELFGADAVIVADVCGLTLTSRDKNSTNPIPMAGVPVVNYRAAIKKCVTAGFKVAVVDQVEDPRMAKGLVKREIVRVATPAVPGDLGEDETDQSQGCYLAALHETSGGFTLAFVDVSTGEFRLTSNLDKITLQQELSTIAPREVLAKNEALTFLKNLLKNTFQRSPTVSAIDSWVFRSEKDCIQLFSDFFGAHAHNRFGVSQVPGGLQVVAGILAYLKATQRDVLRNIQKIETYELANHMILCDSTKRHLDFFSTATGERKGSLYGFLNKCATAAGGRLLARRLNYPFKGIADIETAHASVSALFDNDFLLENLASILRSTADIERLVSRAAQGNLDPRGMAWLRGSLAQLPRIAEILGELPPQGAITKLRESIAQCVRSLQEFSETLWKTLDDEPASLLGKGGRIFRPGFSNELDELSALEQNFEALIADLEKRERENAQISTLKIGYTKVFGYYFEVSKSKISQVPAHFIRKQTLTNGERYTTPELKELEERAVHATERRSVLERELFEQLRQIILMNVEGLTCAANLIAETDLIRNFAALAVEHEWCKPQLVNGPLTALENSVHPILKSLQVSGEPFIANTIVVGNSTHPSVESFTPAELRNTDARILLITGPNMAGKSTIMRQVALAQILCQCGSFVPASRAVMGICDRAFTRIGSADYALRNQSTFMVEMLETAQMLRSATARSLLLMDELGRGTSTYDGLSLAWAILEDIHDRVGARTLFSTHYHELLDVVKSHTDIAPMQMEVIEREREQNLGAGMREIIFSRRFMPGAAGRSYGLHVAELAGISSSVVGRASEILCRLTTQKEASSSHVDLQSTSQKNASAPNAAFALLGQPSKKYKRNREIAPGASLFDFVPYTPDNGDSSQ
jgi:DNA mismatch repair protein MutS